MDWWYAVLKFVGFSTGLLVTMFQNEWNGVQDIPTRFWRNMGEEKFEDQTYTLHGTMASVEVNTKVLRSKRQTWCFFTDGFPTFCQDNAVRVGDQLHFQQIEAWEFEVLKI